MCSNKELAKGMDKLGDALAATNEELVNTRVAVGKLETRLDTWKETSDSHGEAIHELQGEVKAVDRVATSAAIKTAAMFSVGLLAVCGLVTWALKATLGT